MASTKKGFTLIEIIIVIFIMAVLAILALTPFYKFGERELLTAGSRATVALLEQAREATLSSKNDSQYGVHFSSTSVTMFVGISYATTSATNTVITLDERIRIASTSLAGGGSDVIFKRLTGETNYYGTVILELKANASSTRTIRIERTGLVFEDR